MLKLNEFQQGVYHLFQALQDSKSERKILTINTPFLHGVGKTDVLIHLANTNSNSLLIVESGDAAAALLDRMTTGTIISARQMGDRLSQYLYVFMNGTNMTKEDLAYAISRLNTDTKPDTTIVILLG